MSIHDALVDTYAKMARETDVEALVLLWSDLQEDRRTLGDLNAYLEAKIYDLMPEKERRIEHVGLITRYRPSSKVYDDQEITRRIRRVATDTETGEVDEAATLALVQKAAKISYWRVKDLPFPLDDELVTSKYGAKKIRRED